MKRVLPRFDNVTLQIPSNLQSPPSLPNKVKRDYKSVNLRSQKSMTDDRWVSPITYMIANDSGCASKIDGHPGNDIVSILASYWYIQEIIHTS